jgi:arylsulfatase A-like enzyme
MTRSWFVPTILGCAAPARNNGAAGPWELYHVAADRAEIHNLAVRYPAKATELTSLWTRRAAP